MGELSHGFSGHAVGGSTACLAGYPSDWPDLDSLFSNGFSGDHNEALYGTPQNSLQYASASCALIKAFDLGKVTISSTDISMGFWSR